MKFVVRINEEEKNVVVNESNGYYDIRLDGRPYRLDCRYFGDKNYLSLLINNKSYLIESAAVRADRGLYYARVMGRHYDVEVLDELLAAVRESETAAQEESDHIVLSPMPGLILEVKVDVGDEVAAGTPVVVMEAMKMQNELATEVSGIVKEIRVAPKDTVDSQAPLVLIERLK